MAKLRSSIRGVTSTSIWHWYATLKLPPLAPPGLLLVLAWPAALTAVVAGALLTLRCAGNFREASSALGLYFTLLAGAMIWNVAFFGLADAGLAFGVIIVVLLLDVALVQELDRFSRVAALIQLPCIGWLMFAAYFTGNVWGLNPAA
jgi:translocator protein